ncbi:MAG: HDOD domain-containing protein [Deltaproteobacteria bacterium]|nr:HDOD domain-containing protein [Deltaproteobacteria bacterium]
METKPKQCVASGNYVVSSRKNAILEAYLGTCVGVTLCDSQANLGGLSHFLLSEPTGLDKPWKPATYATTGLPAQKNRLKATVAGGALVGRISREDLDLDIGGRTTDVVQSILRKEKIPVSEAETGGYFSCRLSLDLQTLKSSIQPIEKQFSSHRKDFNSPTSDEISHAIHLVRPIPQIALKIARMIHSRTYDMSKVAREIKQDQIISARVIRICNSAFIGLRKKIDSIDRAAVILGEKLLLQLVIAASLEQFFSDSGEGYSLCKGGLFQHALSTAMVAEALAQFTGSASSDIAYTAGLLHDIGKVVLDQYIAPIYPFFYRRTQVDEIDLCGAEEEKLGITHPAVGGLLAKKWALPQNLTDTIRHHHYPEQATVDPELTHLVYLADLLMSRFQVGQELEYMNMDTLAMRMQKVGLTPSQFPRIVDLIPQRVFDVTLK